MLPANHSLLPPNDGLLPPNDKTLRMRNSQMPTMKKKSGCLHLKNKECTVFHRFAESLSTHKFIEIQGKASPKQGGIGAQRAQLSSNRDRLNHTLKPTDGGGLTTRPAKRLPTAHRHTSGIYGGGLERRRKAYWASLDAAASKKGFGRHKPGVCHFQFTIKRLIS